MDLHSAGHRRGVVCAPHSAAVEAGRTILAEGGNALEAMVAMAAAIAAVYPHMNHLGGDGFWLIREPSGRVRRHHGGGPRRPAGEARALSRLRDHPAARAAGGADCAGRHRRLGAGAGSSESQWWEIAARCPAGGGDQPRPDRLYRHAQPGTADARKHRKSQGRAGVCRDVSRRRQGAGNRHDAQAAGFCRNAVASRPCRARRFLSRRRRP